VLAVQFTLTVSQGQVWLGGGGVGGGVGGVGGGVGGGGGGVGVPPLHFGGFPEQSEDLQSQLWPHGHPSGIGFVSHCAGGVGDGGVGEGGVGEGGVGEGGVGGGGAGPVHLGGVPSQTPELQSHL